MIPFTFPSQPSVVSGNAECKVWYLSSVVGMARWIDYIPVRQTATASPIEGRTDAGGYQAVTLLSSISGKQAWIDYVPVYEDSSATVAWGTGADGYIPVGAAGAALSLQMLGATSLDPRITFTRASSGTHFDSTGRLVTDGNNVARFDYDPVTLLPRGLLIEEQRTNLLLHSRDMTQAAWGKTDVTAARTQVGIDGVASSACLMTEGSAGTAVLTQAGAAVTAGSTITGSIVIKRGNTDWVRVFVQDGVADGANAWFNLNTGVKGAVTARGVGTNNASTITNLGGGWYRCAVTTTPDGSYTTPQINIVSASADSSGTRVSGATYIVDYIQLEVGAFATSPIITGAATATRAADNASMTGTNFSSWFNASAGTFVIEHAQGPNDGVNTRRIIEASDNSATTRFLLARSTTGLNQVISTVAGASDFAPTAVGAPAVGSLVKTVIAYASGDKAISLNGAAPVTSAVSPPTSGLTQLNIGTTWNAATTAYHNSHIRSIRYYNQRLSNSQLTALTA